MKLCTSGSIVSAFLFVACLSGAARAAVVTLSATSDTFIVSTQTGNNGGAQGYVNVGGDKQGGAHRALFQFNLSSIPPGVTVTSAVFGQSVNIIPSGFSGSTFDLLKVTASWVEGTGSGNGLGGLAADGETTWNDRMKNAVAWSAAGGDFDGVPLASTAIGGLGACTWSGPGLIAAVQDWLDTPANNHGLLLRSQSEDIFATLCVMNAREGFGGATLHVGYDVPAPPALEPPELLAMAISTNGLLSLVWTNQSDRKYDVLFSRDLGNNENWFFGEANIRAAASGTNIWTDAPHLASPQFADNTRLFYALHALPASPSGMPVRLEVVASNLVSPVSMTFPPDGTDRLFVCEQTGKVLVVDSARNLLPAPFLDLGTNVQVLSGGYDERGLLGLAFHPGYATNRKFYVYYSGPKSGAGINHESILAEFLCSATNANMADPGSMRIVLRFDQPQSNHNGGNLAFGPDGYLYVCTGDGGGAGDQHGPFGNAQVLTNLLGKMLRIDVDGAPPYAIPPDNPFVTNGAPVRPEIFAYGFRNPWRASFDGTNCWVADVGQNTWEEINLLRGGRNYGWRIMEGHHLFDTNGIAGALGVSIPGLEFPIHEYKHGPLGISITGGFVYRGTNYPALQGRYVFGDFSTSFGLPNGNLYYLEETRPGIWERFAFWMAPTGAPLARYVKSFGQDENGGIYLLSTTALGPTGTSGDIRKLLPP